MLNCREVNAGSSFAPLQDIESIWKDVSDNIPRPSHTGPAPPPERVFIVHTTEESAVRPNQVIFAWPPPRIKSGEENKETLTMGEAANALTVSSPKLDENGREIPRMDGSYWADDYAELMKHVELENKTGKEDAWGTFGKTSCTSRFQGGHLMTNEGLWRKIESIFIPYGNITFASYQTTQALPLNTANDLNVPTALIPGDVHAGGDPQQYYDVLDANNASWPQPMPGQVGQSSITLDGQVQSYPPEWEQENPNASASLPPLTGNSMQFYGQNGYPQEYSHVPAQSFPMQSLAQAADMQYHGGQGVSWPDPTANQSSARGTKRKQSDVPGIDKFVVPYQSASERISGSPHGLSASELAEGTTSVPAGRGRKITTVKKGEDGQTIVKVTVAVPPPEGVECCVQCRTRER